ncbi:ribosomal protein S18 acetylase RimI-like enzyme [Pullulanibacillus pueri]|uniref:N-acetyltransferase n=1 Tax=Pullulanibacillus pueri TaxID=1437324 RepID=A0A8J2ZVY1_9BACL|nr:GNAT family N-acetyltransferase [Pullulanibacillus pueri]MBM7680860.1 ribosomal protein S18 acetylase RimI-like enzyme [Pullulanibacillus pueri]GGH81119.1 N-acetyltransferase [Pullulanibacillus pueri]
MEIRGYTQSDEVSWIRCRTLSFLNTAYYDNVLNKKEIYKNSAIEIVAVEDGQIVGLLDIEYEQEENTICTKGKGLGGMIWHIAAHPDFQRKRIGTKLLEQAEQISKEKGLQYLEAWTRDDEWVNKWYIKNNFEKVYSYLQVFIEGNEEVQEVINVNVPNLKVVQAFAHYTGDDQSYIKSKFKRAHDCNCYIKKLV